MQRTGKSLEVVCRRLLNLVSRQLTLIPRWCEAEEDDLWAQTARPKSAYHHTPLEEPVSRLIQKSSMLSLFRRFTTKAKNSPLPPSERGRKGLESGRLIDLENEIAKLPRYHPESCPDGLIDLSGAENDLMLEYMVDKMEAFANNRETSKCS